MAGSNSEEETSTGNNGPTASGIVNKTGDASGSGSANIGNNKDSLSALE